MGIVATHPIAAPVAAPPRPPSVVFAAGFGLHAARPERPEMSTSAPITFITTSYWLQWVSSAGPDPGPGSITSPQDARTDHERPDVSTVCRFAPIWWKHAFDDLDPRSATCYGAYGKRDWNILGAIRRTTTAVGASAVGHSVSDRHRPDADKRQHTAVGQHIVVMQFVLDLAPARVVAGLLAAPGVVRNSSCHGPREIGCWPCNYSQRLRPRLACRRTDLAPSVTSRSEHADLASPWPSLTTSVAMDHVGRRSSLPNVRPAEASAMDRGG
jgi:hypothetical protein